MRFSPTTHLGTEHDFDTSPSTVVDQFAASMWAAAPAEIGSRMALFLTDPAGPINAICSATDFQALCRLALHRARLARRKRRSSRPEDAAA